MKKLLLLLLFVCALNSIGLMAQAPVMQPGDLYMVNLTTVPTNSCAFTNAVCWKQMIGATPSVSDPNASPAANNTCFLDIDNLSGRTLTVTVTSAVGNLIIIDGPGAFNSTSKISMLQDLEVRGNNAGTVASTLCVAPTTPFQGNGYIVNTSNMGGTISSATSGSVINIPNLRINSTNFINSFVLSDSLRSFNFSLRQGFFNSNSKNILITGGSFIMGQSASTSNAKIVLDNSIININGTLNLNLTPVVTTFTNYSGINTTINITDFSNSTRHTISGRIVGGNPIENINNISNKPLSVLYNGVSSNQIQINTISSNHSFQLECPSVVGLKIGTLNVTKGLIFFYGLQGATSATNRLELSNMILGSGCANNSVLVDGDGGTSVWLTNPISVSNCGIKQLNVVNNVLTCNNCTNLGGNSAMVSFAGGPIISDLYWKGAASNSEWDIPSNWCTDAALTLTSSCIPGLNTNVHFLNGAISNSLSTNGSVYCRNMIWSNTSTSYVLRNKNNPGDFYYKGQNVTGHLGEKIYVAGSLNFPLSNTNINNISISSFVFCGTGTHSVTSNQTAFNNTVFFYGTGSYTLMDSISLSIVTPSDEGTLFINQGTFNSNGKAINTNKFSIIKTLPKNVNLSNSNIYVNYPGTIGVFVNTVYIQQQTAPNTLTYTANNNTTFYLSPKSGSFSLFTSNLQNTLLGNIISNSISDASICRIRSENPAGSPLVFNKVIRKSGDVVFDPGSFSGVGNAFRLDSLCFRTTGTIYFSGNSPSFNSYATQIQSGIGTPNTCNKNYKLTGIEGASVITPTLTFSSIQNVYNTVIENIVAQGATANATKSILLGTSSGWTIITPTAQNFYWTGEAPTADWNDWRNWKINSVPLAGAGNDAIFNPGQCLPSFSDNVFFHPNSFPLVDSVNIKTNINFNDMTWLSGITGAAKKVVSNSTDLNIYGSLILDGIMNNSEFKSNLNFYASDNGNVITSKGAILYQGINLYNLKFLGTGSWKITDSLIAQRHTLLHSNGNLDASSAGINKIHLDLFKFNTIGVFTRTVNISGTLIDVDGSNGGASGTFYSFDINTNGLTYLDNISTYTRVGRIGLSFLTRRVYIRGTNPITYKGTIKFIKNATIVELQQETTAGISRFHNVIVDNMNAYIGCAASLGTNTDTEIDSLLFSPDGGLNLYLAPTKTVTINQHFEASGIYCRTNYIQSRTAATQAYLCGSSGLILKSQYITLRDINSGSCAGFTSNYQAVVNSVDAGNNAGWTFGPFFTPLPGFPVDPTLNCSQYPATINTSGFYTTPNSTFLWSNGSTSSSVTINQAGTYSLTITYGTNCFYSDVTTYSLNNTLSANITKSNVVCPSGSNGSATLTINNQSPITNYSWDLATASLPSIVNGTATSVSNLTAGNYTVNINDPNCAQTLTFNITQPNAFTVTPTTGNIACFGIGTGSAQVTVSGGTPGYTYSWTTSSSTTNSATSLAAGNYTATVRDINLCSITQTFAITQPTSAVSVSSTNSSSVTCFGANTGSASVIATGGTPGYTYSWTPNSATTNSVTNLSAGNYTATIRDANNCVRTQTFNITQPTSSLSVASTSSRSVSCFGASTGSASIIPTGGTPGYTYSWTPNTATTNSATSLASGNYTATIRDANNCIRTQTFNITQPSSALSILSTNTSSVLCFGASSASATLNATGGTPVYTYSWTGSSSTTNSATSLAAGNYTATVRDINLCSITQTFAITQPTSAVAVSSTSSSSITCFGANTGSAAVVVTGGTPGYTYSWTPNSATTNSATNLSSGNYTTTIRDANNCVRTQTFNITQPTSSLSVASTSSRSVSCFGASTGSASIVPTGGTPGYTYSWTPNTATTNSATSLATGNYTATIRDANNCIRTQTFNISQPSNLTTSLTSTTQANCGSNNGSASVLVNGGVSAYTYSWIPPSPSINYTTNTSSTNSLSAGITELQVIDANGCISNLFITITNPNAPTIIPTQTNVLCYGESTGAAFVNIASGTSPYTYSWSPSVGTSSNSASGLASGNYIISVIDAANCTAGYIFNITQPTNSLTATTINTGSVLCYGEASGSASISVTGGTPSYTISWQNSMSTSTVSTGYAAGNYTYQVTDANGCNTIQNFSISQPSSSLTINSTTQSNPLCFGTSTGSISIVASGGTPSYTYSWTNTSATSNSANNLNANSYTVIISDNNNCVTTQTFTLTDPNILSTSITSTAQAGCGLNNGQAVINTTGGTPAYTYSWTTPITSYTTASASTNSLSAGINQLTVIDANGCSTLTVISIANPNAPVVSTTVSPINCYGSSTGNILTNVSQGTPTYSYQWSNGTSNPNLQNVPAGTYTLSVTDANNCVTTSTNVLTEPSNPISLTVNNINNIYCFGASTGSVDVTANGGTPNYTYTWQPSSINSSSLTNLSAGNYTITAEDNNGCLSSTTITISNLSNAVLNASLTSSEKATCEKSNGTINVSAMGGTAPYQYQWYPISSTSSLMDNVPSGSYTVIISDTYGCTTNLIFNLECKIDLFIPEIFSPNGDAQNEKFEIKGIENYPNNTINIFNRWGSLVYSKNNYKNEWDGKTNVSDAPQNATLPSGTYYVVIDFGDNGKTETYTGFVQLAY